MSVGTGTAWPGGSDSDLLACAADLRWSRPDLVAAIAEHVAEIGSADDRMWVAAVGWFVHGRSAVGDGRECATAALGELARRPPGLWDEPVAARLRVEVALLAVGAGESERARDIAGALLAGSAPADVRADAFGVLARCTAEERPGSVDDPARRAEVAWAEVGGPHAEIGAASVALVAAAALRRAGRTGTAVERAAEGLSRLDLVRGVHSSSPSRHLAAALGAEWLGSLLDAGRLDEAREGCGPLESGLRERTRPSRQVALLRLTIARAVAGLGESSAEDALQQAATDAATADSPDLEAVCLSTLGALREQAGRLDSALDVVRRGVEAHRRDAGRHDRFLAAVAALPAPHPAPAAAENRAALWEAEPSDSPIGDLVARALGAPAAVTAVAPRDSRDAGSPQSGSSVADSGSARRSAAELDGRAAARPAATAGPERWSAPENGAGSHSMTGRGGGRRRAPEPERQAVDRPTTDAGSGGRSAPEPESRAGEPSARSRRGVEVGPRDMVMPSTPGTGASGPSTPRPRHDAEPTRGGEHAHRPAATAPRSDTDPLFGAFWPDPAAPSAATGTTDEPSPPATNGSAASGPAAHPLAGSPWSTGRWSSVRPSRSGAQPAQGGRRARPEPDPTPPPAPAVDPLTTDDDGWLEGALAELDRVWGTSTTDPASGPPAAPDRGGEVTGCIVVVDVVRSGEPVPGHATPVVAAVIGSVAGHLDGALPAGARLRRDADALSVVMPSRDHGEAGEWMHRVLPPVFAACFAVDGDERLAIRAAVHDVDGPVGAQLIQRLGATTGRRAAGRHDAAAPFRPPAEGGGGRRRRVDPDDDLGSPAHRDPSGRHGLGPAATDTGPSACGHVGIGPGSPGRGPGDGDLGAGPDGFQPGSAPPPDARPSGAGPTGAVPNDAVTTGSRSSRRAAAGTETGAAVARGSSGHSAGDLVRAPGVTTPAAAPPADASRATSGTPGWITGNTEELGIADLLAGALAAYRSI